MLELMLYEGQALKIALYYRFSEEDGVHTTIRDALHNETWELPVQKSIEEAASIIFNYRETLEKIVELASSLD